jgi:hypothetical protein
VQKSGKKVIEIMKELQEAVEVADNVFLAQSAVEEVKDTIGQLAKAAKHVDNGDLHLALAIINDARRDNDLCAHSTLSLSQRVIAAHKHGLFSIVWFISKRFYIQWHLLFSWWRSNRRVTCCCMQCNVCGGEGLRVLV